MIEFTQSRSRGRIQYTVYKNLDNKEINICLGIIFRTNKHWNFSSAQLSLGLTSNDLDAIVKKMKELEKEK